MYLQRRYLQWISIRQSMPCKTMDFIPSINVENSSVTIPRFCPVVACKVDMKVICVAGSKSGQPCFSFLTMWLLTSLSSFLGTRSHLLQTKRAHFAGNCHFPSRKVFLTFSSTFSSCNLKYFHVKKLVTTELNDLCSLSADLKIPQENVLRNSKSWKVFLKTLAIKFAMVKTFPFRF